MAAKHKKSNATVEIESTLSADAVAALCQQLAPSVQGVRLEGATPGRVHFSIRGLGGFSELMTFRVDISDTPGGSRATTRIESFKTTQETIMFIPVTPKSLVGYRSYRNFAVKLGEEVQRDDPSARSVFTERPVAGAS